MNEDFTIQAQLNCLNQRTLHCTSINHETPSHKNCRKTRPDGLSNYFINNPVYRCRVNPCDP